MGSLRETTILGQPLCEFTIHTPGVPDRFDMKATRVPSGEKLGDQQLPTFAKAVTEVSRSEDSIGTVVLDLYNVSDS